MFKKIFFILFAIILIAYILFAVFFLSPKTKEEICSNVGIEIVDSLKIHLIEERDINRILKKGGIEIAGKKLSDIQPEMIENTLEENKLIKKAECYKTTGGGVRIKIYQKEPIMRVMSNSGNYYIDSEGGVMPVSENYTPYLPIATGYVEKEFATTKLHDFALFLQNNKNWNAQIEQIYVHSNHDVELTPRVGNFQIILGQLDDFEKNLDKLKLFYEKGLNEVGWNRYSVINLKYKDQVVCTKK